MSHIHSKGIMHRDLKSSNIYIDANYYPKICNFEYAKKFNEIIKNDHFTVDKTSFYIAPELINNEYYDQSIDIYAFSMILYETLSSELPTFSIDDKLSGKKPPLNPKIPQCYADLFYRCCEFDPKKRPSFNEIASLFRTKNGFIPDEIDFTTFVAVYEQEIGELMKEQKRLQEENLQNLMNSLKI